MKKILVSFMVIAVLGTVLGVLFLSNTQSLAYVDGDTSYNRDYWAYMIEKKGAQEAYAEFKKRNSVIPPNDYQHFATHIVGELLFQHEGVSGIQYCDDSFRFGCYHGFFGQAVSIEGRAIIPQLDALCVEVYGPLGTGCQHGIGHGIMEYVGGDRVNEALTLCEGTTQLTKLLGCTAGVFMEYNRPLIQNGDEITLSVRVLDSTNPYNPCTQVSERYLDSCYFGLGVWYIVILGDQHERQHTVCAGVADPTHRSRCFMGLGALFLQHNEYNVQSSITFCKTSEGDNELSCRAGVSWSLYANPLHRLKYKEPCQVYGGKRREECLLLGDLTEGLERR